MGTCLLPRRSTMRAKVPMCARVRIIAARELRDASVYDSSAALIKFPKRREHLALGDSPSDGSIDPVFLTAG